MGCGENASYKPVDGDGEHATCEEVVELVDSVFEPVCNSVVGQAIVGCSAAE